MIPIDAPFSKEEVENLNKWQQSEHKHPFTCVWSRTKDKNKTKAECERMNGKGEGKLIATEEGWICPCGEYKQYWAHGFMALPE
jgi:hypothetical protein